MAVPLTGQTLQASLKMRCDMTGAQYAIYWTRVNDDLKPTGVHIANPDVAGFVEESKMVTLDATGWGPVATVKNTQEEFFVHDVSQSELKRKGMAFKYGVSQVAMTPYEDGVIEVGNLASLPQWSEAPKPPIIPKVHVRKAFEDLSALYVMFWALEGDTLKVIADYENPRDTALRTALRSDGESFVKISRRLTLDANGDGPAARALRTDQEVVVNFGEGARAQELCVGRSDRADEFSLCSVTMVPVKSDGQSVGVLEYGVSTTAELNPVTLDAMLKMQVQASQAAYGIYWKQDGNVATAAKTFTTPEYSSELYQAGKPISFVDVSQQLTVDVSGPSPVAEAIRTRSKIYVPDAIAANDPRAPMAGECLVGPSAYVPVLGGVIEYGTTIQGNNWRNGGPEAAFRQTIPNEELEKALASGATYMLFWQRDEQAGVFKVAASYERPSNALNEAARDGDSYIKAAARTELSVNGNGPIGVCARSAAQLNVPDTAKCPNFKRRDLALEWGVGSFTAVPLEMGVLEYGTVTRDKRETTTGSEYKESSRQYRRTVFMHKEWEDHRATERFLKSMATITESGVLKGRYREISLITAFASAIVAWNTVAAGWTDFELTKHPALIPHLPVFSIPLAFFSLTGSSLGLLLVFRTNAAYGRWDNARKVWGSIINNCRSLVRQGNMFCTDDRYPGYGNFRDYRRRIAAETSAFTRCLRCFLRGSSDEANLEVELKQLGFSPAEVAGYMSAGNKQCYALQKLSETGRAYGMNAQDRARFDTTLSVLCDDVGACERIFKSPIPLIYTRHTSRYVGLWLGLLPLAIWGADPSWNHLCTPIVSGITTFLLLGIEELGLQIEEPFGILPIEAFIDGAIYPALNEAVVSEDKQRQMEQTISDNDKMAMAAPVVDRGAVVPVPAPSNLGETRDPEAGLGGTRDSEEAAV